jgi:branched-chain amino acid transport system permease protein
LLDVSFLLLQMLNGLASASSLFIISAGLTVVFGVTRIVNFAHGSFYMLGVYFAVSIIPRLLAVQESFPAFLIGVVLAALATGMIGVAVELLLLRRIYGAPELFQLLATFGVVLVVEDLVLKIWGPLDILGPRAPGFTHALIIFGQRFPAYEALMIAIGPIVLCLLWLLMGRTRYGVLVRAATEDREMVAALGVNQALLFTATLFLGAALAGLGGALQTPRIAANPQMDAAVIAEAFVVTVVGGMGSITGAFIAALLIGELQAFGILLFPKITLVLVFLLMALVLSLKPSGLMGREDTASRQAPVVPAHAVPPGHERPLSWTAARRLAPIAAAVLLLGLPLIADAYRTKVAIEVLIFALAAFSLNLLVGTGGIVSFGHAAFFGLGAYAAGLLATKAGVPMLPALIAAPLFAALGGAVFGFFVVRLSGIYLAMLTLALAQIVHAVAFQWVALTGGDNGIVGVWPPRWVSGRAAYYYLCLAACTAAVLLLRRTMRAPFGYALRAARDARRRAEAIGIDVRVHRWIAFAVAAGAAGLAGALFAFSKGSIDPTLMSIDASVELLVMILLGGLHTLVGPLLGAALFHAIKDTVMPLTDAWRLLLGAAIIALVLLFPQGVAGGGQALARGARRVAARAASRTSA